MQTQRKTCADCGQSPRGVVFFEWNGVNICENCWRKGNYQ